MLHGDPNNLTNQLTNYMEQNPSSEANRSSVNKFLSIYGTRRFIIAFTSDHNLPLSSAKAN